ncbi:MAG: peptidylprolyl isomerase [Nanoarchaeota archaeon]
MADIIKKNDFIELDFTGRVKNSEIFDTNISEEAKKIGLEIETRPLIICVGQNMILPAIDEFLEGKELGKYTLELPPEKAFGLRNTEYLKTMPIKIFHEKKIVPQPGMVFQFDNLIGRVSAVSGGRVIVDFNNPLAGKEVVYDLNTKKKIQDTKEKAEVLINFYLKQKLDFEIQDKKLLIKAEKKFSQIIDIFKPKFKEILDLDIEVKELEKEKETKPEEKPQETKEKAKDSLSTPLDDDKVT